MAKMRALLCLALLLPAAVAQDAEPAHVRLRKAEVAENERLQATVEEIRQEFKRAGERLADLGRWRQQVSDRFERIRDAYAKDSPDVPTEDEVLSMMRQLKGRTDGAAALEELNEEEARYLDLRDEAASRLVDFEASFAKRRQTAKTAYEKTDGGDWTAEAAAWDALAETQRGLLKEKRRAAATMVNQVFELKATQRKIDTTLRRTLFLLRRENLFLRGRTHITTESIKEGFRDLRDLPGWLATTGGAVAGYVVGSDHRGGLIQLLGILAAAAVVLFLARRWVLARAKADGLKARVLNMAARVLGGLRVALLVFVAPLLAAQLLTGLPPGVRELLRVVAYVFGGALLARILLRELLRPGAPERALVRVDDQARRRLIFGVRLLVTLTLVFVPFLYGLEHLGYGNQGMIEFGWLVYKTLLAAILLFTLLRRKLLASLLPTETSGTGRFVALVVRYLRPVALVLVPTILICDALRYDILSGLLTRYSVAGLTVLAAGGLAFRLARWILGAWLGAMYPPDKPKTRAKHDAALQGTLFGLKIVFFLFLLSLFMSLAGSDMDELRGWLDAPLPFLGGSENPPTWWNLVVGIFLAAVFIRGTGHAKAALQELVLARTSFDPGVQYTITTLVGYVLVFSGIYLGIREVFDLSNLGYIVAALSVGIGFGLQEIISNFVSGLILLFERPLKVGDLIEVGTAEGVVKQINIRATTVLTRDNVYMLVPNRNFIGQTVVNFRHHDPKIRHHVAVGVSYGSDTALVKRVLEEVAAAHEEVLERPAPEVWFRNFGNSSLDFELLIWITDPPQRNRIHSELCFAIFAAFAKHGIEIPFPQRDLHLKSAEPLRIDTGPAPDADQTGDANDAEDAESRDPNDADQSAGPDSR